MELTDAPDGPTGNAVLDTVIATKEADESPADAMERVTSGGYDAERPEWLPSNFRDGEALLNSYNELRREFAARSTRLKDLKLSSKRHGRTETSSTLCSRWPNMPTKARSIGRRTPRYSPN
jgi:hypothetical protein